MKVFLDANILVSVLNKEYPLFPFTSRILSCNDSGRFQLYTSPVCLAIAFYFAEKRSSSIAAKKKISALCTHIAIAENSSEAVFHVLKNPSIHDFEDGLEYYAAVDNDCTCIVTENKNDFYFSNIEVINSTDFVEKYLLNQFR